MGTGLGKREMDSVSKLAVGNNYFSLESFAAKEAKHLN